MSTRINYTAAEKASFALVPETCPAVDRALETAFRPLSFDGEDVAAILAKYNIVADRNIRHAMEEVVGRALFMRKKALTEVVLYEGTFPLRAALVREVERSRGLPRDRNHFEEWIEMHDGSKRYRAQANVGAAP